MNSPVHQLNSRHFVSHHLNAAAHLSGSRTYTSIVMFSLFFTFSIIAVLLLLWFIYLKRREEELERARLAMGGVGLIMPPVQVHPSNLMRIAQEPFIRPPLWGFLDCQQPVLPVHSNPNPFIVGMQQQASTLPHLPMPPMTVTPTTLMSMHSVPGGSAMPPIIFQETVTMHSPIQSRIDGMTTQPSIMPFGVGMPPPVSLPIPTSIISNMRGSRPITSTQ